MLFFLGNAYLQLKQMSACEDITSHLSHFSFSYIKSGVVRGPWTACPLIQTVCVFYKAHHSHMARVCMFKCHFLLPGFVWGLSEVSVPDCTSPSACLLPMMHLPISSPAKAVKEAIVPVTLRDVACTYDTEWEKWFPLYPWNVFESINSMWISAAL